MGCIPKLKKRRPVKRRPVKRRKKPKGRAFYAQTEKEAMKEAYEKQEQEKRMRSAGMELTGRVGRFGKREFKSKYGETHYY